MERPGKGTGIRDMVECPTFKPLIKSLLDTQLEPITDTIRYPIRIAWGECDRLIPYRHFGPPMRERIPEAEFRTLPGVGHVPMPDDPALVARTILEVTRPVDAGCRPT